MKIYYNCHLPLKVIATLQIRTSSIFRGVSLSESFNIGSHGPFKLEFDNPSWLPAINKVIYMSRVMERTGRHSCKLLGYVDQTGKQYTVAEHDALLLYEGPNVVKVDVFADEAEWWSPRPISFTMEEVTGIYFMRNAPNLHPRITAASRRALAAYGDLYREITIDDPYLTGK